MKKLIVLIIILIAVTADASNAVKMLNSMRNAGTGTATLTPSLSSGQTYPTEVTFTAGGVTCQSGCEYQLWRRYQGTNTWEAVSSWQTSNVFVYSGGSATTDRMQVKVRNKGNTSGYDLYTTLNPYTWI